MPKNPTLKMAIFESGLTQIEVAKAADMHESRLSHIINGHREANEIEQRALARVLKRRVRELFSESAVA
jgi:transcriptional regulator with XRE-family HTH domain